MNLSNSATLPAFTYRMKNTCNRKQMFKMRSEIIVLKNTIFWYKIRIFGCQNTNFCFSKLAGLPVLHVLEIVFVRFYSVRDNYYTPSQ